MYFEFNYCNLNTFCNVLGSIQRNLHKEIHNIKIIFFCKNQIVKLSFTHLAVY